VKGEKIFRHPLALPETEDGRVEYELSDQYYEALKELLTVKNFLETRLGKELDVHCGGAIITGKVTRVDDNVLHLEKDDVICYINIEKIIAVWDSKEKKQNMTGFGTPSKLP